MPPTVAIIALYAIKYGVDAARALIPLFQVQNPTMDDWEKVFALSAKSPDDYIEEAKKRLGV